jgi:hypothetical protein
MACARYARHAVCASGRTEGGLTRRIAEVSDPPRLHVIHAEHVGRTPWGWHDGVVSMCRFFESGHDRLRHGGSATARWPAARTTTGAPFAGERRSS